MSVDQAKVLYGIFSHPAWMVLLIAAVSAFVACIFVKGKKKTIPIVAGVVFLFLFLVTLGIRVSANRLIGQQAGTVPTKISTKAGNSGTEEGTENNGSDAPYEIEQVYKDKLFHQILTGEKSPIIVAYGLGGEGGYVTAQSQDKEVIDAFIEAFRELTVSRADDDAPYTADGGEDIAFGMEDGTQFEITLDARTLIHTDKAVYRIGNTGKLDDICIIMQEMATLNSIGGQPGDGYIAVLRGGLGELSFETYVYETKKGYKYINVRSATVSWGASEWSHKVSKIGYVSTKEEIVQIASRHGAGDYYTLPGDDYTPYPIEEFTK